MPNIALFRSLGYRPFALLWFGQAISQFGDRLYAVALAWWVLEKTGSAAAMGTVLVFFTTPMLLFLLVGGVLVDRLPRRTVMLWSDLLSGTVITVVTLLAFSGRLEIWHVYIASALFGFVSAFFEPAYAAIVPDLTPTEALTSANSLTSLSRQFVGIGGPALGALLIGVAGTSAAFALDALTFFVSAACIAALRKDAGLQQRSASAPASSMLGDLRDGWRAVFGSAWLWITIALASLGNITFGGPFAVALPFLIKDTFHADVAALGLVQSAFAAGAVLTAVLLGRQAQLRRRGLLAYVALVVSGIALLSFGLASSIAAVAGAALVAGAAMATFGLIWVNTLQELVPRAMLGRVASIDYLGSFMLLPVGYALAGWATDQLGAPAVFVLGGALSALLMGLGLLHPAIRNLD